MVVHRGPDRTGVASCECLEVARSSPGRNPDSRPPRSSRAGGRTYARASCAGSRRASRCERHDRSGIVKEVIGVQQRACSRSRSRTSSSSTAARRAARSASCRALADEAREIHLIGRRASSRARIPISSGSTAARRTFTGNRVARHPDAAELIRAGPRARRHRPACRRPRRRRACSPSRRARAPRSAGADRPAGKMPARTANTSCSITCSCARAPAIGWNHCCALSLSPPPARRAGGGDDLATARGDDHAARSPHRRRLRATAGSRPR